MKDSRFVFGQNCSLNVWKQLDHILRVRVKFKFLVCKHNKSIYAPISNAEEAEVEQFCEDLQDRLEITPKKDVLFIIGDWNVKRGSQETPGVTGKFSLGMWNEARKRLRVLPRKCTGYSKHPLPTTQEKTLHMDITRWSTPKSD